MNENSIVSQRKHVRMHFSPLTTSCSLYCATPLSPVLQVKNATAAGAEFEPSRSVTPTVIMPDVQAMDPDDVFRHGNVNDLLDVSTIRWYVNGKEISQLDSSWKDKVEVITDASSLRGGLRIFRDVDVSEKFAVSFRGEFLDTRTGVSYKVESEDPIVLSTTDKGSDLCECSIDKPVIVYDPVQDPLLLREFINGALDQNSRIAEALKEPDKTYLQRVRVMYSKGETSFPDRLPSDVSLRLRRLGTDKTISITQADEDSAAIYSISYPYIVFDMRVINNLMMEVQFVRSGSVMAHGTISLSREMSQATAATPKFGADLVPGQDEYFNEALVQFGKMTATHPELFYNLQWYTQARTYNASTSSWGWAERKLWQRGRLMECAARDLGIGTTYNDAQFEIGFEGTPWPADTLITDESGNILTDENDAFLID